MSDIENKAPTEALSSQEENSQIDFLNMSDEDFMKQPEPVPQATEESESEGEQNINVDHIEDEDDGQDQVDGDGGSGDREGDEDPAGSTDEPFSDEKAEKDAESGDSEEAGDSGKSDSGSEDVDYKAKYEALMAPFRANGKEIKVDSPEDLIRLAQMGANYNSKMHALKPNLKIIKMLQNNDLLDESKLNFLIDLSKKDQNAITKLIKDSGINPLDIDTESTEGYKPRTYTVQDRDLLLDEVLDEVKTSPTYSEISDVISNKWDEASRRVLMENPAVIRNLNIQMQNGIYNQIAEVVERERMLGRLAGVSDLDAYIHVGNHLNANGAFKPAQPKEQPATTNVSPQEEAKETKRKNRKRAAGTTRSKPAKQTPPPKNVINMSDEEFEKLMPNYL